MALLRHYWIWKWTACEYEQVPELKKLFGFYMIDFIEKTLSHIKLHSAHAISSKTFGLRVRKRTHANSERCV